MPDSRWRNAALRLELPAILLVLFVAVLLVRPYGDFPLNDDENHAIGTWNFVHLGRFVFAIDTTPPLRAQVLWGALWTKLFGESFDVLRASTLVLAALTLLIFNRMLARAGAGAAARSISTLALLFNPLFFWAAHTYMTEVPYVFATALALYCLLRALQEESTAWMLATCCAIAVSWWIRQGIINIVTPIVLLSVYRARLTRRWRLFLGICVAIAAAYIAMWFINPAWLVASPAEFHNHYKMWGEETFRLPEMLAMFCWYFFYNVQNTTIAFLPLAFGTLFLLPSFRTSKQRIILAACVVFMALGAANLTSHGVVWPYYTSHHFEITIGNVMANFGLGPPTVTDVWTGRNPYPFTLPYAARFIITWATALLGGVALASAIVAVAARVREPRSNLLLLIGAASAAIGTVALFAVGQYFDRYSLDSAWPFALLLALIIPWGNERLRVLSVTLLAVMAIVGVLAVQEYFAWNRARWAAYWELRNEHVPLKQIDGGAEPYLYFEVSQAKTPQERRKMSFGGGRRDYMLAFAPMPGYGVVARHPWRAWLGWHRGEIVTLKRE